MVSLCSPVLCVYKHCIKALPAESFYFQLKFIHRHFISVFVWLMLSFSLNSFSNACICREQPGNLWYRFNSNSGSVVPESIFVFQAHNYLSSSLITQKQFDKTWTSLSLVTSDYLILKTGEIAASTGAWNIHLLIRCAPVTARWMQIDHHRVLEHGESSFSTRVICQGEGKGRGFLPFEVITCRTNSWMPDLLRIGDILRMWPFLRIGDRKHSPKF